MEAEVVVEVAAGTEVMEGIVAMAAVAAVMEADRMEMAGFRMVQEERRKRERERRDNQRARLLAASDVSEVHLPQDHADLPHQRPGPFAPRPWPGTSLENLGSVWRATPFVWPLGGGGGSGGSAHASPVESPQTANRERDRDASVAAFGSSTARPALEERNRSSSSRMRRMRGGRFGEHGSGSGSGTGSGFGFGFPFGVGGATTGYQSLESTPENEGSTPESRQRRSQQQLHRQHPSDNTSSSLFGTHGHGNTDSQDSTRSGMLLPVPTGGSREMRGELHKSPLPPSYIQHVSDRSRGSDQSHVTGGTPGMVSTPSEPLTRPNLGPIRGPRPIPDHDSEASPFRPPMGRLDTAGSIWEVPPTYTSLERQHHQG
ncbi:hypothetical protein FRC17_010108 [Serendipita sp. 399]|nr:hypothetical protein FRC17_010108 [Serendipita sp. 399]